MAPRSHKSWLNVEVAAEIPLRNTFLQAGPARKLRSGSGRRQHPYKSCPRDFFFGRADIDDRILPETPTSRLSKQLSEGLFLSAKDDDLGPHPSPVPRGGTHSSRSDLGDWERESLDNLSSQDSLPTQNTDRSVAQPRMWHTAEELAMDVERQMEVVFSLLLAVCNSNVASVGDGDTLWKLCRDAQALDQLLASFVSNVGSVAAELPSLSSRQEPSLQLRSLFSSAVNRVAHVLLLSRTAQECVSEGDWEALCSALCVLDKLYCGLRQSQDQAFVQCAGAELTGKG